jgi:hypothetical protein
MATLYFQYFESTHRILHVPSFWDEYENYWRDPVAATIGLRIKVLLVVAIGSSFQFHGEEAANFHDLVRQWICAAQMWLSGPLEKDRLNINGIQIHCLVLLARQLFSVGGDLVSLSAGTLINSAMQIGLHRDPKYLPKMSVLQAEVRRRLWATILELLVQSSLDSAIPTRITLNDFDTEAPSNINDDEIDNSTTTLPSRDSSEPVYTQTLIQLVLHKSLPTRLRTLRLLNDLHSDLSYQDVIALTSEVTEACGIHKSFAKVNGGLEMLPFHQNLLDYLIRRFLLPMHCAFAMKARKNALFHYSRTVSLETALAIISTDLDERFCGLVTIGGGLFREGLMQAAITISIELIAQAEDQRDSGTLSCMAQSRELLKKAVRRMISISLQRLSYGETSIKSHLFFSMVLAHVEALEAGASCELKIAQAAVGRLEHCHELLLIQAGGVSTTNIDDPGLTGMSDGQEGYDLGLNLDLDLDLGMEFFFSDGSSS